MDANQKAELDAEILKEVERMKAKIQTTFDKLSELADNHFTN